MSSRTNPRASSSANRSLVGETISGCQIREMLHQGAMGTIYRAHDALLQRDVAVTLIHPRLLRLEGFRDRLKIEVERAIDLKIGNNASVLRYEFLQPWMVIISRFVEGHSLRAMLNAHGRLNLHQCLWIMFHVFQSLGNAHDLDILHRDIKPDNILLTPKPEAFLVSWGILRIINATTRESLSSYGNLYGSPEYMAPDQITLGDHRAASDLYSAGITFFEALTGVSPFHGDRIMEILKKQIVDPVPSVRHYVADCPPAIDEFIQSLTAKDPARRPQHSDLAADRCAELMAELGFGHEMAPFQLNAPDLNQRQTQRISTVTTAALQALAERMQNSASLGMLAFEDEDGSGGSGGYGGGYGEMTFIAAPPPELASTQQLLQNALQSDALQALRTAFEQGKADRVVPEVLEELFKSRRYSEILNLEEFLKSALPTAATVPYYLGLTHEAQGAFDAAAEQLFQTLALAPHHLPASLHCARCLTELKRIEQAEHVLREAVKMAPTSEIAAAKFAEFLFVVKGDGVAAVPAYQRAIRLAPNQLALRKQLAWVLMDIGHLERADEVLAELREWSGSASEIVPLIEELERRKALTRSSEQERAAAQGAQDSNVLLAIEWPASLRTNNLKIARKNWASVRDRFLNIPIPTPVTKRSKPGAPIDKIQKFLSGGNFRKAADHAKSALSEDQKNVPLLLLLGRADFELGEYTEAIQVYKYVLKLDPENDEARSGLSAARVAKKAEDD